jgi:low affinity Fe/Cu permease
MMGTPWAFIAAAALVIGWAVSGPFFGFSDSWELVINTSTTIITFLMVFLIQNTQNRDARAMHLKIDEIIYSLRQADNDMINIEELSDEELAVLAHRYQAIKSAAGNNSHKGRPRRRRPHQLTTNRDSSLRSE